MKRRETITRRICPPMVNQIMPGISPSVRNISAGRRSEGGLVALAQKPYGRGKRCSICEVQISRFGKCHPILRKSVSI